jgi:Ca2+-binding EF-hand superfamily protein
MRKFGAAIGTVMLGMMAGAAVAQTAAAPVTPAPAPAPAPTPAPKPSGRPHLFISPMGEPFRAVDPQDVWFNQADTNHDGALSRDEFLADAMRFFKVLDHSHDGEIDPDDLDHYETELVPEIRVGQSDYETRPDTGDDSDDSTTRAAPPYPTRLGAGRYSYFEYPEPIAVCDKNFNRGVDVHEFQQCANDRFDMLDTNHDGMIRRDELPTLPSPGDLHGNKPGSGKGSGHGRGMGGHHGGMGGMGGGGMGGSMGGGGGMGGGMGGMGGPGD